LSTFSSLGLSDTLLSVLPTLGFEKPTPIQEQAIPILTNGLEDFIGLAQTGTGKTAAFGLPLIDLVDGADPNTQALIMAPTRELGMQTAKQLTSFAQAHKKVNVEVVYGGADISKQIRALKKPTQIVVATPGRLLDLIKRRAVNLGNIQYVVLDEADEMLNMGFKEDIDEILSHTPDTKSTWLFSATMPKEIRGIVKRFMVNPKEVSIITKEKTNKDIDHQYVITKAKDKVDAVRRFLDMEPDMRAIMFCRTRRETQSIAEDLSAKGYNVDALHGELSQNQREVVMKRFKSKSMQLLVATDVAARGIDVNDLTHVINHTLPDQLESYTHRSGRTGRAGNKGVSLVLINPREQRKISEVEKKIGVKFTKVEVPSHTELMDARMDKWVQRITNTEIHPNAAKVLDGMHDLLAENKEQILLKLLSVQLNELDQQARSTSDLNAEAGDRPERKERSKNADPRYFINVGSRDGLSAPDMIDFLTEMSGVSSSDINDLSLLKNCAYFDISRGKDKGFTQKFSGLEIEGREIRVNRDEESSKPRRRSSGGGGGRPPFGGKGRGRKPSGGGGRGRREGGGGDRIRSRRR